MLTGCLHSSEHVRAQLSQVGFALPSWTLQLSLASCATINVMRNTRLQTLLIHHSIAAPSAPLPIFNHSRQEES